MKVLEVLTRGLGITFQDEGRHGWRRFGVPPSGAMDPHAAAWANRLLDNDPRVPVLELCHAGASFRALADVWVALTGADADANIPLWRATLVRAGDVLSFPRHKSGTWTYLAVQGGFVASCLLGSSSSYPRATIGDNIQVGSVLGRRESSFNLPAAVAGRLAPSDEQRNYASPPPLRLWKGPQWDWFDIASRTAIFAEPWTVTPQSDRAGYRLAGVPLMAHSHQLLSEPVLVGSIQVPENGQPIVTMRDGPTVGGYPKIGLVDADDLAWLAQCTAPQKVRFKAAQ